MRHVPGVGAVAPVGTGYPPPKTTLSATWLVKATFELQVPEAAAGVGHNATVREAAARAARKRMFTVPTSAPMAPRTRLVVQAIIALSICERRRGRPTRGRGGHQVSAGRSRFGSRASYT